MCVQGDEMPGEDEELEEDDDDSVTAAARKAEEHLADVNAVTRGVQELADSEAAVIDDAWELLGKLGVSRPANELEQRSRREGREVEEEEETEETEEIEELKAMEAMEEEERLVDDAVEKIKVRMRLKAERPWPESSYLLVLSGKRSERAACLVETVHVSLRALYQGTRLQIYGLVQAALPTVTSRLVSTWLSQVATFVPRFLYLSHTQNTACDFTATRCGSKCIFFGGGVCRTWRRRRGV